MLSPEQLPTVDRATLLPLTQAATNCPNLQIDMWQTTLVSQQGRRRIVRFAGTGQEQGAPRAWSLILKVIQAPEGRDDHDEDMSDWAYWPRESLLYEIGIPQTLVGGLRAPRCFGVVHPAPNLRWIWLEDLHDRYGGTWPLERYALAASHLGAFNGAYLMGVGLPRAPWLSDNGLRSRSAHAIADLARLRDPTLWNHPLLRHGFPRPVYADLERLAGERERFLAVEARLPRTFCHLDAWHGNMAAVLDDTGADVTVLFDWALAGYGAPGAEISNIVWTSLLEFKLDMQEAERLEAAVMHSYLQGLADAGWHADSRLVRCAYLISSVLLFGLVPEAVDHGLNTDQHMTRERQYGWPIDQLVRQAAEVTYLLLRRAEELRSLLDSLSL
jgi:Phosphotransferase enzyme family